MQLRCKWLDRIDCRQVEWLHGCMKGYPFPCSCSCIEQKRFVVIETLFWNDLPALFCGGGTRRFGSIMPRSPKQRGAHVTSGGSGLIDDPLIDDPLID